MPNSAEKKYFLPRKSSRPEKEERGSSIAKFLRIPALRIPVFKNTSTLVTNLPKGGNFWLFLSLNFTMTECFCHVTCFVVVSLLFFFLSQTWYFYRKIVITFYHKGHTRKVWPRTQRWDLGHETLRWDPTVRPYGETLRWDPKVGP